MVMDAMRLNHGYSSEGLCVDEEPNVDTTRFVKFLKDFDEPLWDGCTDHNKLLAIVLVFTIKSNYDMSDVGYDSIIKREKTFYMKKIGWKRTFMIQNL